MRRGCCGYGYIVGPDGRAPEGYRLPGTETAVWADKVLRGGVTGAAAGAKKPFNWTLALGLGALGLGALAFASSSKPLGRHRSRRRR